MSARPINKKKSGFPEGTGSNGLQDCAKGALPHPDYQRLLQELRHQQGGGAAARRPPAATGAALRLPLAAQAGTGILPSGQKAEVPGHMLPPREIQPPSAAVSTAAFAQKHGDAATQADLMEIGRSVRTHMSSSTAAATSVRSTEAAATALGAAWPTAEGAGPLRIGQAELQRRVEALREAPVVEVPDLLVTDVSASAQAAAAGICSLMREPISLSG